MISRRRVVLGGACTLLASGALAQRPAGLRRIGFLADGDRPFSLDAIPYGTLRQALRDAGRVEGRNLAIEWRFAESRPERLPGLAADLAKQKVDLIVAAGAAAADAARNAARTIPVVVSEMNEAPESGPKYIELVRLLTIIPTPERITVLANLGNPTHAAVTKTVEAAARASKMTVSTISAREPEHVKIALPAIRGQRPHAIIVLRDGVFIEQHRFLTSWIAGMRLPSIAGYREYAEAGGLMSYGPSLASDYRRLARRIDRILKGAKADALPIEGPDADELVINARSARTVGLVIPPALLARANLVID